MRLLVVATVLVQCALPQPLSQISGVVRDPSGAMVGQADIAVINLTRACSGKLPRPLTARTELRRSRAVSTRSRFASRDSVPWLAWA